MSELVNDKLLHKKKELIHKIAKIFVVKNQIYRFKNIKEAKNSQLIKFIKEKFTGTNHFRPDWVNEKFESSYNKKGSGNITIEENAGSTKRMFNLLKYNTKLHGYDKFGIDIDDWSKCFQIVLMFLFDLDMQSEEIVDKLEEYWFWQNLIKNWKTTFYIFYLYLIDDDTFNAIKEVRNSENKNKLQKMADNILTIPNNCNSKIWFANETYISFKKKEKIKYNALNFLLSKIGYNIKYSNDIKNFITNKSKCYQNWIDKGVNNQDMTSEELYYIVCWAIECNKNITISYGNHFKKQKALQNALFGGADMGISSITFGSTYVKKKDTSGVIYEYNKTIYLTEGKNPKYIVKNVKIQVNN